MSSPIVEIANLKLYNPRMAKETKTAEADFDINELIRYLTEAVHEANNADPNALGVILYGSRTHMGMARPDSDVDMVYVQQQSKDTTTYILEKAVNQRLRARGFVGDFRGAICIDWIDQVLSESTQNDQISALLCAGCLWIDRESIFITVDREAEQKIREFTKLERKRWTKMGMYPK